MNRIFKPDDIVQHFKRETIHDKSRSDYLYIIVGKCINTETGEQYMAYKPLYDVTKDIKMGDIVIRPLDMFMSEVDHDKYPSIKQKYRFEHFNG